MSQTQRITFLVFLTISFLSTANSARADLLQFSSLYDLNQTNHGLEAPTDLVITDDSQYVYIVGSLADTLSVFERNSSSHDLTFITSYTNDSIGGSGLRYPWKVTLSPEADNNQYLYVISHAELASGVPNTLAVFERDPSTGVITFLEAYEDTINTPSTLGIPEDMVISPNGNHIYLTDSATDSVSVFTFDPAAQAPSNRMSHLQLLNAANQPALVNLVNPRSIAISPDGLHIYVAASDSNSIIVFSRNPTDGMLSFESSLEVTEGDILAGGTVSGLLAPFDIQLSPEGNHVYVANLGGSSIVAFARDRSTGTLDYIETYSDGGAGTLNNIDGLQGITSLRIISSGKHVVAKSPLLDAAMIVFSRNDVNGELTPIQWFLQGTGTLGIVNGINFEFSPDNRSLYSLSNVGNDGRIGIYSKINEPPVLSNDLCIVAPDTQVTIDVLANDEDADGPAPLQLIDRQSVTQGIANFTQQAINYTSPVLAADASGALIPLVDTIVYNATDSSAESDQDAEVTILVNGLPDSQDHVFNFDIGNTETQMLSLLTQGQAVLNNPVIILPETMQSQKGGLLELNTNGTVSYTPPVNNNGDTDTFFYTVVSEDTQLFADNYGLQLVSDNSACLQTSSTGEVTVNFINNEPAQSPTGNDQTGGSSSSKGGGSLYLLNLLMLLVVLYRRRSHRNKIKSL